MNTINYSVHHMQSEEPSEKISLIIEASIPEVMQTTSAAPPALTFAEMQKPAEALPALVPKKQYYGFS